MIHLRCEIAIPSGLRRSRVFARLEEESAEELVLLQARGLGDATHQLVDAAGYPLLTFLSERDPGLSTDLIRSGFWELPETVAVLAAIRPGAHIIDAGAQVGYYTVLMARAARRTGRVFAFEPEAANYRTLAANASLATQTSADIAPIDTFATALTTRTGNVRLHRSDRNPGDHSLTAWPDSIDSQIVAGATIDSLRWNADGGPALDGPIDLIKVDVNSGEVDVLKGAERTLSSDRPLLVLTLRPAAAGPDAGPHLLGGLATRGYGTFRLLPNTVSEPYQLVCDSARVVDQDGAIEILRRRPLGNHLTLLAYPDPVAAAKPLN